MNRLEKLENDNFLRILLDVSKKTVNNAIIQNSRMKSLWKQNLEKYNVEYHEIRNLRFNDADFLNSIDDRVIILQNCENIMVDCYWAIKMFAIACFQSIPKIIHQVHDEFVGATLLIQKFKLKIAEKLVNSLMVFFTIEKDIIGPIEFVYGKLNTFLRVRKRIRLPDVISMMEKAGYNLSMEKLIEVFNAFKEIGLVQIDGKDAELYHYLEPLTLTTSQDEVFKSEFEALISWAVETWRTMFNIRELNTPIPEFYPQGKKLAKIVSYAATQGFTNAHFCFKEIKNYFMENSSNFN